MENIFSKIVFGAALFGISFSTFPARSGEKIAISKDQKNIYQKRLSEFPLVHEIHKGEKMVSEKKDANSALKCSYCHLGYLSTPVKENLSMPLCLNCHTGKIAPELTCIDCHQGTAKIFNGIEAIGVKLTRSNMIDLDCNDCHAPDPKNPSPLNSCMDCHEKSYNEKMIQIQTEYTRKLATIKRRYSIIKNYIRVFQREQGISPDEENLKAVAHNFKFALMDGSRGIHNNEFILEILNQVENRLFKLREYYKPNINNLFQDIQSNNREVRLKAVEMIGEIGDKKGEKYLKHALNDPDRNVRLSAKIALIKIKALSKGFLEK